MRHKGVYNTRNGAPGVRSLAAAAALAIAAFGLTGQGIAALYRYWHGVDQVPVLARKLAHLEANLGRYDLVFAGSSRVYREFDTETFDAEMAAAGCPVRSYNLGFAGMNIVELRFLIERLAALPGNRLRWLLIEEMPPVRPSAFGNERSRFFMRLSTLPLAMHDIATTSVSGLRRAKILALVLYAHAYEAVATGMLASLLPGIDVEPEERAYWEYSGAMRQAGFLPLDEEIAEQFADRERALAARGPEFRETLARAHAASVAPAGELPRSRLSFLAGQLAYAEARLAVRPALVLMPDPQQSDATRDLAAGAAATGWPYPLLDLNDFGALPWLTDERLWFDKGHLDSDGAARVSETLAGVLCPLFEDR